MKAAVTVVQADDGTWMVKRGRKIINGLTNEQAWSRWDELDRESTRMEETRRRVSIATGQW